MLALLLEKSELKTFMNKLLLESFFDSFDFREAAILGIIRFELDGKLSVAEGEKRFRTWKEIKPYVLNIIKGSSRPESMKFVFSFDEALLCSIDEEAKALFLNVVFEKDDLYITTGCASKSFSLDKSVESKWDEFVIEMIKSSGLKVNIQ